MSCRSKPAIAIIAIIACFAILAIMLYTLTDVQVDDVISQKDCFTPDTSFKPKDPYIDPYERKYMHLVNTHYNQCFDSNGTSVYFTNCDQGNKYQQWSYNKASKLLSHEESEMCLNEDLRMVKCNLKDNAQKWEMDLGILQNNKNEIVVASGNRGELGFANPGLTRDSWSRQWLNTKDLPPAPKYQLIINSYTGKCLDGDSTGIYYNFATESNKHMRWYYNPNSQSLTQQASGKVLRMSDSGALSIVGYNPYDPNQKWSILGPSRVQDLTGELSAEQTSGYFIYNEGTKKPILPPSDPNGYFNFSDNSILIKKVDFDRNIIHTKSRIALREMNGTANTKYTGIANNPTFRWGILENGTIANKYRANNGPRLCLDSGGGADDIRVTPCDHTNPYQKWDMLNGNIIHKQSGKCLDGNESSTGVFYLHDCIADNPYQKWQIEHRF